MFVFSVMGFTERIPETQIRLANSALDHYSSGENVKYQGLADVVLAPRDAHLFLLVLNCPVNTVALPPRMFPYGLHITGNEAKTFRRVTNKQIEYLESMQESYLGNIII